MASKKQIEANRRNRAKWHGHTREGLERLSIAAQHNEPWQHSTGPKTVGGKNRSKMNALKHGCRSQEAVGLRKELNELIREMKRFT